MFFFEALMIRYTFINTYTYIAESRIKLANYYETLDMKFYVQYISSI